MKSWLYCWLHIGWLVHTLTSIDLRPAMSQNWPPTSHQLLQNIGDGDLLRSHRRRSQRCRWSHLDAAVLPPSPISSTWYHPNDKCVEKTGKSTSATVMNSWLHCGVKIVRVYQLNQARWSSINPLISSSSSMDKSHCWPLPQAPQRTQPSPPWFAIVDEISPKFCEKLVNHIIITLH